MVLNGDGTVQQWGCVGGLGVSCILDVHWTELRILEGKGGKKKTHPKTFVEVWRSLSEGSVDGELGWGL